MNHRSAIPVIASFVCLALGACSYAPKPETAAAADYGTPMTASEMQGIADKFLVKVLKDPESRRVEWGRSGKAWAWTGLVGGGTKYGYGVEADVNAKNSFGGYVGSKPYFFLFRNGVIENAGEVMQTGMYGFVP